MKEQKLKETIQIPSTIKKTAKILEVISPKLATKFAIKLFITPIRYKTPKREFEMNKNSNQYLMTLSNTSKKIMVYEYGDSPKRVLLVHGWSGRGTQLVKIAEEFLKNGYSTISFDAPGHGKAPGKSSNMTEFIDAIHLLHKKYNGFDYTIGHSLGGLSILNALKQGYTTKKAVIIGSGDVVEDIMDDFIHNLGLNNNISKKMKSIFEKQFNEKMENYSGFEAAKKIEIPVLVIHDNNDYDVPVTAGINIHNHLKNAKLMLTNELGHRKILGDKKVIKEIIKFTN